MADVTRVGLNRSEIWYDEAGNQYSAVNYQGGPTLGSLADIPKHLQLEMKCGDSQILPGDACYIGTDGLAHQSIGTTAGAQAAKVVGFALNQAKLGDPVSLIHDVKLLYAPPGTLTIGESIYLSGLVAGNISQTASTGGTGPIGFAVTDQIIFVKQSGY